MFIFNNKKIQSYKSQEHGCRALRHLSLKGQFRYFEHSAAISGPKFGLLVLSRVFGSFRIAPACFKFKFKWRKVNRLKSGVMSWVRRDVTVYSTA